MKPLSNNRGYSRIKSVTTIRYHAIEIRSTLYELHNAFEVEPKNKSDTKIFEVLGSFQFLLSMVI